MKRHVLIALLVTQTFATMALAQGNFTDLDFEAAQLPFPPSSQPQTISVSRALPGWSLFFWSQQETSMYYNNISAGGPAASLIDENFRDTYDGSVVDGSYSLILYAGGGASNPSWISQSGTVPTDSMSLQFVSFAGQDSTHLQVFFGGTSLAYRPLRAFSPGYTVYGADISQFAGQSGELKFVVPSWPQIPYLNHAILDDIQFVVPEPRTWALLCFGGLALWGWRSRRIRPR